jgi:hypothetical protein
MYVGSEYEYSLELRLALPVLALAVRLLLTVIRTCIRFEHGFFDKDCTRVAFTASSILVMVGS